MRLFATLALIAAYAAAFTIGAWPSGATATSASPIIAADHAAVDHPLTAARSVAEQGYLNPPYVAPYAAPTPCQINPSQPPLGWSSTPAYQPFTQPLQNSPAIASPFVIKQSDVPHAPVPLTVTEVSSPMVVTQRTLDLKFQLLYGLTDQAGKVTPQYPGPTIRVTSDQTGQPLNAPQMTTPPNITQLAVTNGLAPSQNVPFPYVTTHLHGGHTAPEHDGHPSDLLPPNPTGSGYVGTTTKPPHTHIPNTHVYSYTNDQQPQILWYHDHADMNTSPHVAQGLYSFYIIQENPLDPNAGYLPLPQYDIPLGLQVLTAGTVPPHNSSAGVIQFVAVNGYDSPVLNVQPRWYRFRLLNASASQSISIELCAADSSGNYVNVNQYAWVIGTDGGMLQQAIQLSDHQPTVYSPSWLDIFQAERYDMLIDFAGLQAQGLTSIYVGSIVRNGDGCVLESAHGGICSNPVLNQGSVPQEVPMMLFDVSLPLDGNPDTTNPRLLKNGQWTGDTTFLQSLHPSPTPDRLLTFEQSPQTHQFLISGQPYDMMRLTNSDTVDSQGNVTSYPAVIKPAQIQPNSVEIWELRNTIPCATHPVHVHDIEFQVIAVNGVPLSPEQSAAWGWKDVFVLPPVYSASQCPWVPNYNQGTQTNPYTSITFWGYYESHWITSAPPPTPQVGQTVPWLESTTNGSWTAMTSGTYVFHCHNLDHEDNVMMGQFQVLPPPFIIPLPTPTPPTGSVPGGIPERARSGEPSAPSTAPWGGQPPGNGPPGAAMRGGQPPPGMYVHGR